MAQQNFLDYTGLQRYDGKIKDVINTKQDALVSGQTLKTINNQSLLGSGNIAVGGAVPTNVKIDGTSITSNSEADILTINGNYNSSTNKIATASDLSGKVNATNVARKVYCTNTNGEQVTETLDISANAWTIPQRDGDGQVMVGLTPTNNYSATSKQYVDTIGTYDILYQGANTTGNFNITNISNYKFLHVLVKIVNAWCSTIVPVPYILSEIGANRDMILNANDNSKDAYRYITIQILTATSIALGGTSIDWCLLLGVK